MPIRIERQAEPIPGYKLVERLGGGGFGEVWKVEAPGGLLKAIKFVYGDLLTAGDDCQRADQELKALSRVKTVRHPYILSLERYDIIDGKLMIVMELADRNLWDRFRECRSQGLPGIPRDELLGYMVEAAEALDLMNQEYQLQHLDIKPQNLFLIHNHVKVADFGLVKDLQGMAASVTGGVTPVYAAPETFDGWVSRYCDQYSLSIVYQELLTGQRPFSGNNVHQLVMQHVQAKPNLSSLSANDQEAVGRALAKNPDDRFPSCRDLVRALRPQTGAEAVTEAAAPPSPKAAIDAVPDQFLEAGEDSGHSTAHVLSPKRKLAPDSGALEEADEAVGEGEPSRAAAEILGEGELFPALVLGLGQTGRDVLQQLRKQLRERFGSLDYLPHLRLLNLDTDPVSLEIGARDPRSPFLTRNEVLTTRLQRASYYLAPPKGRPRIDTWFDATMLYRIQRNQVTGGVRALGRLAFVGNYRMVTHRLRSDLQACLDGDALTMAARKTGLKLRSNRPRVYIVTSLAGGTGSGMFIDLAYVVRDQLKKLGYAGADIVGLFFLPSVDPQLAGKMLLGNTVAALTELNHFGSPDVTFSAQYEEREPPLKDPDPPFSRCFMLSAAPTTRETTEAARMGGDFLCQDLTTPLGRVADANRAPVLAMGTREPLTCQTFGLFRVTWPRHAILERASQRWCLQLVRKWMSKDSKPVQEPIQGLVKDQVEEMALAADSLITRFQNACEKALGKPVEFAFAAITDPFFPKGRAAPEADWKSVPAAMNQLEQLVGQPSDISLLHRPGELEEPLRLEAETLVADCQNKLARFIADLVEQPRFRLGGAEEATRAVIAVIEKILATHEPLGKELVEKAAKGIERMQFLFEQVGEVAKGTRRGAQVATELGDLLRLYPKWRYHSLVLRQVNFTLTSLRGFLSDQIREIGFYRLRLGELLNAFQVQAAADAEVPDAESAIYPVGCRDLGETLDHLFPTVTAAELDEFDGRVQNVIRAQFISLCHVCTASSTLLKNLQYALLGEAEAMTRTRLAEINVATTYLSQHPRPDEAQDGLAAAYDKAGPRLEGLEAGPRREQTVLVVPRGPQEDRLRSLAQPAVAAAHVVASPNPDEIVIYREEMHVPVADLEQLGPLAQETYQQMMAVEHFTPHSRTDITEWLVPAPR